MADFTLDMPRNTPRSVWKFLYREHRIAFRKLSETVPSVFMDYLIYGTGVARVTEDGNIEHVSVCDFLKTTMRKKRGE